MLSDLYEALKCVSNASMSTTRIHMCRKIFPLDDSEKSLG